MRKKTTMCIMTSHFTALLSLVFCCLFSPTAYADLALANAKNCTSCHAVDRKIIGPSFKDVAKRYRGDATAPARLARKVLEGGGGVWGVVKMPSNTQISEAEAKKLVAWVLTQ